MTHLTESDAHFAAAYVVADEDVADSPLWELVIARETTLCTVHAMWQKSVFNEDNLSLDRVIAKDHCNEWLVYASNEDKIEFMRSAV